MKILKAKKGISTIIAVLLMIVISVAAAVITYIWIMGYLGGTMANIAQSSDQENISIDTLGKVDNNTIQVVVRNVGDKIVTLDKVFVDGLDAGDLTNELSPGDTATITVDKPSGDWVSGTQYVVKIVCKFGGSATESWTAS